MIGVWIYTSYEVAYSGQSRRAAFALAGRTAAVTMMRNESRWGQIGCQYYRAVLSANEPNLR